MKVELLRFKLSPHTTLQGLIGTGGPGATVLSGLEADPEADILVVSREAVIRVVIS